MTFQPGFTTKDAMRSAWAFAVPFAVTLLVGGLGIVNDLVESCHDKCDVASAKTAGFALAIGVCSSALIALKNFLLADGSTLKG